MADDNTSQRSVSSIICRICHGGDSNEDLLTPCRCRGSIALAHIKCLERWLSESNRNHCELCQYKFRVIRQPKYSPFWSIFVFLRHPGENLQEIVFDFLTLLIYTPSTITSSYMLMLLCETVASSEIRHRRSILSSFLIFTTLFGIATINFTYASWLSITVQKHTDYWRRWYRKNCYLKLILSEDKLKPLTSASNEEILEGNNSQQ